MTTISKAATKPTLPDVNTLKAMYSNTKVKTIAGAILALKKVQDMEAFIERIKAEANDYLYENGGDIATFTDADGTIYTAKYVENNERRYTLTDELKTALDKLEVAKMRVKKVQDNTPFEMVPKGRGFYYKLTAKETAK